MNRLVVSVIAIFLLLTTYGCPDRRQPKKTIAFPPTIEEMERLTKPEIAALADIKIPRGTTLNENSLRGDSKVLLRLKRNSIFAQYGYPFTIKWIREYFETRPWYKLGAFNPSMVDAVDTANIRMIQQYENRINPASPFVRVDRLAAKEMKTLPDIRAALNTPIDESTLRLMNKRELKILKNSIFAQYGRSFKTAWLQKYFDSRSWYKAGPYNDTLLTEVDQRNVDLIMKYENAGDQLPEQQILQLGYCENEAGQDIERYVFKQGNILQYSLESQSPYGRSGSDETLTGQWRLSAGGIEYRFTDTDDWEALRIDPETHLCR